jgi:hypothetical protein
MQAIESFFVLAALYAVGDFIGTRTKAKIPSIFVIACLFMIGYWTFFPNNIVVLAGLGAPLGGTIAIIFCITHMGTIISLKELIAQWKIIVIALVGLVGMVLFCLFCVPIIGKANVVAGLPSLTGGVVAAGMMQAAAVKKDLISASVLAICMYVLKGFVGYPLTAILLKKEGRVLLSKYNSGAASELVSNVKVEKQEPAKKKLIPAIPDKYNTTALILAKMALIGVLAYVIQTYTGINACIVALVLSIIATEIGLLDTDSLHKAGAFGFLMFVLMIFVFSGLSKATPSMIGQIILPLIILIVFGVIGMVLFSAIAGKLLHVSPFLAIATALTAFYGFPPNYVLTEEAAKALAKTPEETSYLIDQMLPQMIVGGFVTVTITSVIIAGIFVNLL